jgi:hypothetical protein
MNILNKIFGLKAKSDKSELSSFNIPFSDFITLENFGQFRLIFDFVLNPNDIIAQKAALTVHRSFAKMTEYNNKHLYETFRYLNVKESDIDKFERFTEEIKISLLCITSLNGNGYSREKALTQLAEIKNHRVFPFLLYRLADWVPTIQKKAAKIIEEYLTKDSTILLIRNHKQINWLLNIERADLSDLYEKIVISITNRQLNNKELSILNDGERLFYYKSYIQKHTLDVSILEAIFRDKYYLIRFLLINHLEDISDSKFILSKLLTDKSQKIRQRAIFLLSNQHPEEFQTNLELLVFDISSTIRYESRKLLNLFCKLNFTEIYKEKIERSENLIGSILGLSDIGSSEDTPLIFNFLKSSNTKIKTAALIGLHNLDKNTAQEISYQIIEKKNPNSIKKVAEFILSKQGIDHQRLRRI